MSHSRDAQPAAHTLDSEVFLELLESLSQPAAVAAVYRKFVENAAAFIAELHQQDAAARGETLHTLKGSAAMMGADSMAKLAAALEAQGASVQVVTAMQELQNELARFREAVSSRLLTLGVSLDQPEP